MTQQRLLEDAVMDGPQDLPELETIDRVDEDSPEDLPELETIDRVDEDSPEDLPELETIDQGDENLTVNLDEPLTEEDEPFTGAEPGEPFVSPITLQDLTNRMIELYREKLDLKTRSENNTAEIKLLEPVISTQFAAQQIQQQKNMKGETVFLHRDLWTSLVQDETGSVEEAHQALRDHGLAWLVKDNVNGRTLSAWVREQAKQETEIPEDLLPFLKISKAYRVKVRL